MEKQKILLNTLLGPALESIANISENNFISDDVNRRALKHNKIRKTYTCWEKHAHEHIEMSCVIDGVCAIGIKEVQYLGAKGDVFFYPPEIPHYESWVVKTRPYKMLWFSLGLDRQKIFLTSYDKVKGYRIISNLPLIRYNQELKEKLDILITEAGKRKRDIIKIKLVLFKLIEQAIESTLSAGKAGNEDFQRLDIKTIEKYIIDNFDKNLSVSKLSRVIMLSPNYLSSIFKKNKKISLSGFINSVRIGKAKDIIKSGKYKMKEVASLVGYEDQYYFSRMFKALSGCTPSDYKDKF